MKKTKYIKINTDYLNIDCIESIVLERDWETKREFSYIVTKAGGRFEYDGTPEQFLKELKELVKKGETIK